MSKPLVFAISEKTFALQGAAISVLADLAFEVDAGEFVCLLGPSGCGKTTILRLILGLDTDYRGAITLGGQPIIGPGTDRGVVFQEPRLLPWMTVRQNIEFAIPASADRARLAVHASELIALVGLTGFETAWPNQLSGGMAQRCALARALMNIPSLLLLDEPFAALDSFTRVRMQEELAAIHAREGTTTLMVTHDVDEAIYLANRIIVLKGRPGTIACALPVRAEMPRDRASAEFLELRGTLLRMVS